MGERRYGAGASNHPLLAHAVGEVIGDVADGVGLAGVGLEPQVVIGFASGTFGDRLSEIAGAVHALLKPRVLVLVASEAIISGPWEHGRPNSLSMWAGAWDDLAPAVPVRLEAQQIVAGSEPAMFGLPSLAENDTVVVIGDGGTVPSFPLLELIGLAGPGVTLAGGLILNRQGARPRMWLNDREYNHGAVGVVLPGGLATIIVSQGAATVGQSWTVTEGSGAMIHSLGGAPAMQRLTELQATLEPDAGRSLLSNLALGVLSVSAKGEPFDRDFHVVGVRGADHTSGSIAIDDPKARPIRVGDTVQFRDRSPFGGVVDLFDRVVEAGPAQSMLMFSSFDRVNSFITTYGDERPHIVMGQSARLVVGMFCDGEFGRVGDRVSGENSRIDRSVSVIHFA